jgi:DUF438 domain-containing protein
VIKLEKETIITYIVESIPYPVLFVDCSHTIRYMNKAAKYHYYAERGYKDLIGKPLFECHNNEHSKERIIAGFEKIRNHGQDIFIGVNVKNQRVYMNPVRDENGELVGYFERIELNLQK